jgi:hypothetical protein
MISGIFINKFQVIRGFYCVIRVEPASSRLSALILALGRRQICPYHTLSVLTWGFDLFMCRHTPRLRSDEDQKLSVLTWYFPRRRRALGCGFASTRYCTRTVVSQAMEQRSTTCHGRSTLTAKLEDGRVLKLSFAVVTRLREADTEAKLLGVIPKIRMEGSPPRHHLLAIRVGYTPRSTAPLC